MIEWLVDLYGPYVSRIVLIVSPSAAGEARQRAVASAVPIEVQIQEKPTGMLDAFRSRITKRARWPRVPASAVVPPAGWIVAFTFAVVHGWVAGNGAGANGRTPIVEGCRGVSHAGTAL